MSKDKIMPHAVGAFLKGIGIKSVELDAKNHIIVHYDNGKESEDIGEIMVDQSFDGQSTRPIGNKAVTEQFQRERNAIESLSGSVYSLREEMYVKDNVFYATMFDKGDVALTNEDRERNYTAIYTLIQRYGSVDALPKDLIVYLVMKDDRSDDGFTKYQCDTIKSVGGKIVVSFVFPYCKTDDATEWITFTTVEITAPFDTEQLSVGEIEILTFCKGAVTNTIDPGNDENPVSGVAVADYVTSRNIVFKATKEIDGGNVYLSDDDKSWAVTCIRELIERDNSQQLNNEYIFIEVLDPTEQNTYYRAACSKHSTDHGVFRAAFTIHEEANESSYEYYLLEIYAPFNNNVNASDIDFMCDHINLPDLMAWYYAKIVDRGYTFRGIYDENATIDERERMVFYIAQGKGQTISNIKSLAGVKLEKGRIYALKNISKTTDEYDDRWEYDVIAEGLVTEERLSEVLSDYVSKAYLQTDVIPRIEKKANNDEYYPAMAVGTADNLRGRGEATDTQFTYRPSAGAGNNITEEGVATMKRIKGNTVVWNNQVTTHEVTLQSINDTKDAGEIKLQHLISNRKYFIALTTINANNASSNTPADYNINFYSHESFENGSIGVGISIYVNSYMFNKGVNTITNIFTCSEPFSRIMYERKKDAGVSSKMRAIIVDLTQMFGVGNEPTTVEEFYERMPAGIDIKAYNAGELIPVNTESIETNGFNQWDEQWAIDGNRIYSKNLISVLPNTDYYVKGSFANGIFWYDENKQNISTIYPTNAIVKSPATARYMRFYLGESYGTTYKNDICINLSHSGVENGRYEEYVKSVIELPEIAQCFPDGLKSAGAAFDEINETQAIKRVGVVDLGELGWEYGKPFGGRKSMFYSESLDNILNIKGTTDAFAIANILCAHYSATSANTIASTTKDKAITVYTLSGYKHAFVADTSYTDGETFKNAMSGVKLYFELKEPEVIELLQRAINLNYAVWDWGTERAVSNKPSAPFRADTIYGFNAVDTIRMNKADIEKLLHRVAELEARIPSAETPVTEE